MFIKISNRSGIITLLFVSIFTALSISACDNSFITQDSTQNDPGISGIAGSVGMSKTVSKIDGKPVITMSASDFYNTNSAYLNKVVKGLAKNGARIVKAFNKKSK